MAPPKQPEKPKRLSRRAKKDQATAKAQATKARNKLLNEEAERQRLTLIDDQGDQEDQEDQANAAEERQPNT